MKPPVISWIYIAEAFCNFDAINIYLPIFIQELFF